MDQSVEPLRYVRGAVKTSSHTHTHTHTQSFLSCSSADFSSLRRRDGLCEHTHKLPARLLVCVCVCVCVCAWAGFGLGLAVSRCLADGHWAHREGGAGAPTSHLGQRVNTHTIQRCCMRNQCEFGKLHNINLF